MIYDDVTHIHRYLNIHPNLDIAIKFLKSKDLNSLSLGDHVIKQDEIWCTVMEASTKKKMILLMKFIITLWIFK
ncbi:hypothetical protein HMPREF9088_1386 [Enterococcus italicus DSM 15952]|uniref:Uncharacterized protein n=1 Tax=Enterococcus italicus (strain DSM 15952 / CCUG 50447 / LMG 22039 / TP 1.5) TaxID=888064 RepID=E6LG96_ENTI1|nr:hypothetical protein HMPREF9088_1386 [Enterococcus italicus DSM 15952]